MTTQAEVKTERWTIAVNDWPSFDIVKADPDARAHSDEWTNGTYPSRLAAIEQVIADYEEARAALSYQIARAKRMRNRTAQGIEAGTATTAGRGPKDESPVAASDAPDISPTISGEAYG